MTFKQHSSNIAVRLKRLQEIVLVKDDIKIVFCTVGDEIEDIARTNTCLIILPKGVDGSKILD